MDSDTLRKVIYNMLENGVNSNLIYNMVQCMVIDYREEQCEEAEGESPTQEHITSP